MESHQLMHEISQQLTPGAEGAYVTSLKKVVQTIGQVEKKIKDDQTATQAKVDSLFQKVQSAHKHASAAKQIADQDDKAWFECVAA